MWGKGRSHAVPSSSPAFSRYSRGPFLPQRGPRSEPAVAAVALVTPWLLWVQSQALSLSPAGPSPASWPTGTHPQPGQTSGAEMQGMLSEADASLCLPGRRLWWPIAAAA